MQMCTDYLFYDKVTVAILSELLAEQRFHMQLTRASTGTDQ
jgi:hypothetical protein